MTGDVEQFFDLLRGEASVSSGARVFETRIRRNIRLAEAPSFAQTIFQYAPESNGAADYRRLAQEVLRFYVGRSLAGANEAG